jgi:hypothetical protein
MVLSPRLKRGLLAVAVLTTGVLGAVWLLWPEPPISPANFRRIELGMTQAEIEAIIGLPPGVYYGRPSVPSNQLDFVHVEGKGKVPKDGDDGEDGNFRPSVEWVGHRFSILVDFEQGQATCCRLFELAPPGGSPGMLDRIRSWLGW